MFRMKLLMVGAIAMFLANEVKVEAGGHYLHPVPVAVHAPVYSVPVIVPQPVVTYYQPTVVVHRPVIAPYYYPVTTYYAPAPVVTYPAYVPVHRDVEIKYKWRHGRYKVEYDFDD